MIEHAIKIFVIEVVAHNVLIVGTHAASVRAKTFAFEDSFHSYFGVVVGKIWDDVGNRLNLAVHIDGLAGPWRQRKARVTNESLGTELVGADIAGP